MLVRHIGKTMQTPIPTPLAAAKTPQHPLRQPTQATLGGYPPRQDRVRVFQLPQVLVACTLPCRHHLLRKCPFYRVSKGSLQLPCKRSTSSS